MTIDEAKDLIRKHRNTCGTPKAYVAAYNQAIEDALELYYNPTSEEDQDTFDKDLESLKIRN
jgi:hypothetical protein